MKWKTKIKNCEININSTLTSQEVLLFFYFFVKIIELI